MKLKLSWQDYVLIASIVIVVIVLSVIFSKYQHIPGPLYGGDLYRERGIVQHLVNGGHFWEDPYFQDGLAFHPPFGYLSLALFTKISNLELNTVMNFSPILVFILQSIAFYLLGLTLFKKKSFALLLFGLGAVSYPILGKFTYGLGLAFTIFAVNYFIRISQDSTGYKNQVLFGLFAGLASICHLSNTFAIFIYVFATIFFEFIISKKRIAYLKSAIKRYLLGIIILILISAIFFAPLLFVYHMKTLNPVQEYCLFDISKHGLGYFFVLTLKQFFNFSSIFNFISGLLAFLGLIFCFLNFRKPERRFIIWWMLGAFLAANHYHITAPLFDKWMVPGHIFWSINLPIIIFKCMGLYFIYASLKTRFKLNEKAFVAIILLLLIAPGFYIGIKGHMNDRWTQYGMTFDPPTQAMYDLADWISTNTDNNDIFLGNDESMFALQSLTGRKSVMIRRTHASPYVDVNKRYADAMVMLYGNNSDKTKELIKEYGVTYFYHDSFLLQYPMLLTLEYKEYLDKYGVTYSIQNVRLDPSTEDAPYFDALVVPPQNLTIIDLLEEAYRVRIGSQTFGTLYKISY